MSFCFKEIPPFLSCVTTSSRSENLKPKVLLSFWVFFGRHFERNKNIQVRSLHANEWGKVQAQICTDLNSGTPHLQMSSSTRVFCIHTLYLIDFLMEWFRTSKDESFDILVRILSSPAINQCTIRVASSWTLFSKKVCKFQMFLQVMNAFCKRKFFRAMIAAG